MDSERERIQLGIDGDCGYAMLGTDLQSGECEFVQVDAPEGIDQQLLAAKRALRKLRERLDIPNRSFFFGPSHPYGN
jgi:hypothetical protein